MRQSAMPGERPVAVLVFAILNIVFGSLGAVVLYCALAILTWLWAFNFI